MGKGARSITVDFVSVVTHEIRTPLTAIQGGASVLKRHWKELPDETVEQLLDGIDRQAARLNDLITSLLDLSRLDRDRLPLEVRPVDVDAVVAAAVGALEERGEDVELDIPANLWVRADSRRLGQVLVELLENAVDHGGAQVRIEAAASNGDVELTVADGGSGVDEDLVPTVFDRFVRGTVGDHAGWGLGLALVRELTEAQGGRVDYAPNDPSGARFTIVLPATPAPEQES